MLRIGWLNLREVFLGKSWLEPELVSAMARTLPAGKDRRGEAMVVPVPVLRDAKDDPRLPNDLLPARFPGSQQLPLRLALQLHESYDEDAVSLLKQVGLPSRPPLERMKSWVRSGLKESECRDLLRYLSDAGRWRRDYYELGPLLTAKWFSADGAQLTTTEAFRQGFVRYRGTRSRSRVSGMAGHRHRIDSDQPRS